MSKDASTRSYAGASPADIDATDQDASAHDATDRDASARDASGRHASAPGETSPDPSGHRILRVVLGGDGSRRSAPVARDVEQAVRDLQADSLFQPRGLAGPFDLRLRLEGGRLLFDIRDAHEAPLAIIGLALGPFRRLIKDYLLLLDSHGSAMADGRAYRLEAIDMGRRALHNEGAELIIARLENKVAVGFETARRLFTLVCVLHQRF